MKKIKTIIVDDETKALDGLKVLLKDVDEIELCAACENGVEAIESIEKHKPDLLFLDIQMPEVNGFEVLNNIPEEIMPVVIFTTAYDQYALKAFEMHAVDYLLKPFSNERFYESLNHAKKIITKNKIDLLSLISDYQKEIKDKIENKLINETENNFPQKRLVVKSSGKIYFLNFDDIKYFEAEDYYLSIHTKNKNLLIRESLKNIEQKLPANQFVRIHRSRIINSDFIEVIQPHFNNDFYVTLKDGSKLKGSRNYKENLNL